jgi:exopolyphosphatase/guanosine-5'-triphosphate,3'-diphosphate pyrophosphatase
MRIGVFSQSNPTEIINSGEKPMENIIPRWEWRTFTKDLGKAEENIRKFPEGKTRESAEVYILSEVSMDNTKVRDNLMDIKTLQQVNEDRLEQWLPIMKGTFPLPVAEIEKVFKCFKVALPKFSRLEYTFQQYLDEVIMPSKLLKAVNVLKNRTGFTINNCIVEIAEVRVEDKWIKTAAVEMEDPALVIKTVRELGLDAFPNINYLRGLKNLVGMK